MKDFHSLFFADHLFHVKQYLTWRNFWTKFLFGRLTSKFADFVFLDNHHVYDLLSCTVACID